MTQAFPSNKPLFADIKRPGKSYPFDSNIKSMMKIGTPVNITSISADKKWFYVKSHLFNGWAFASDIALTSRSFEKNYMSKKYCIAIKDQISIEHNGSFIANVNIGVTLPVKNNKLLVPFRNSSGKAEILHCNITNGLVERPLKFTRENISNILKEMIGTKYGWGGYLENRDCSMLTSDFFAIFGKHLINYSGIQVSSGENVKDLNCKQKEDFIKQNGIPFLTLAGYEGHVMLYVGIYDDAPVFLHNVWGLRMSDNKNTRYIIGKTILSKFNLGNYKNLAERVNRVVFFSRKVNP